MHYETIHTQGNGRTVWKEGMESESHWTVTEKETALYFRIPSGAPDLLYYSNVRLSLFWWLYFIPSSCIAGVFVGFSIAAPFFFWVFYSQIFRSVLATPQFFKRTLTFSVSHRFVQRRGQHCSFVHVIYSRIGFERRQQRSASLKLSQS